LRFGLTSLGILWGAFMLTYLSASMQGMDDHFTQQLERTGPKIVIVFPGTLIKNRVGERGARSIEFETEDVARLAALDSIEEASPNLRMWNRVVRAGRRTKLLNVTGVAPVSQSIRGFEVGEGRFLTLTDIERNRRVAFLGSEAAKRLFGRRKAVGLHLQIESESFRVVGVAQEKGNQLVGINGRDDLAVLVPFTTMQRRFLHDDKLDQLAFAPQTREMSFDAIVHTRQLLGLHHDFDPTLETALTFFNVHEIMQMLHTIFFGLRFFMLTAGIVTLIVGAIGVMNIMLVVVAERTNEIGLRKAIGARSRTIFIQFLAEAVAVSTLSGLIGAALGVSFTVLVAAYTPPDSPLNSVPVLDPFTVAVIVVALGVVGILAGVIPAIRAAQVDPSDALRAV
jgi:putative ABC transport system permease protein